jgi:peptide/nickel transport system permease protein
VRTIFARRTHAPFLFGGGTAERYSFVVWVRRMMPAFIIRRLLLLAATLLAVSILIFLITQMLPGDVATMILGMSATPDDLATLRRQMGLDQPAISQYLMWLGNALHGDLGISSRFRLPVTEVMSGPIASSVVLGGVGILIAVPLGVGLGLTCALRRDSTLDRSISAIAMFAAAMPEFVTGGLMIVIFSSWLSWVPPFASAGPGKSIFQNISELVLPTASLSLVILAYIIRMMRASTIDVLDSQYVKAAILKGMSRTRIIFWHVLPIALGPTLAVIALSVGWMAGGLVVVENLFGYPGIGRLLVFAIQNRDIPLLQAIALVIAATYAVANLAADVMQRWLDPRVAKCSL